MRISRGPLMLLFVGLMSTGALSQDRTQQTEVVDDPVLMLPVVKGQLLVTLHRQIKPQQLETVFKHMKASFRVVSQIKSLNQCTIATDHQRLHELRYRLANHPYVAVVGLNVLTRVEKDFNDPVFSPKNDADDWNLHRIRAPAAWDTTTGGAVIAIIDSGSQIDHEELSGRTTLPFSYWSNGATMQKGVVEVLEEGKLIKKPVRGHGTHVAITAAGTGGNGKGTVGVAPSSPVMPIQVLYYFPARKAITSKGDEIQRAMNRAMDGGAKVINMSLGVPVPAAWKKEWSSARTAAEKAAVERKIMTRTAAIRDSYKAALDRAQRERVIVVAAAGNQNLPARFAALPYSGRVISVAATGRKDQRAYFSNYGEYTTVSAPGMEIYSGYPLANKKYTSLQGTSMAAPHVAGLVSLMKTVNPNLSFADVRGILIKTAAPLKTDQPIGPMINAKAAVEEALRRRGRRGQPLLPPLIPQPPMDPGNPHLPPRGIDILKLPNPWDHPDVQRLIDVWLSTAVPKSNPQLDPKVGPWYYDKFGRMLNNKTVFAFQPPIWAAYRYRWLWENSQWLNSQNLGTLYEFIVGSLKGGKFNPAPPRVPPPLRPTPADPKPPKDGSFDGNFAGSRWKGRNISGQTIEVVFTRGNAVTITLNGQATRYTFRINTFSNPPQIDLRPVAGGDVVRGLIRLVGYGEVLFRSDFNSRRPTGVSRQDAKTFVLRRTDRTDLATGNADGAQLPVLHQGTETLVVGLPETERRKVHTAAAWKLPTDFGVHKYALSRDGQRLWIVLYNGKFGFKGNRWQLWSMNIDGTGAKQSAMVPFPPKTHPVVTVLTSHDGGIAWLHAGHTHPQYNAFLQVATPGTAARLVVDIAKVKGFTGGGQLCLTADGKTAYVVCGEGIARVGINRQVSMVMPRESLKYSGQEPRGNSRLEHLAIDGTGSKWAIATAYYLNKKLVRAVIVGSGSRYRVITTKLEPVTRFSFTDNGDTLLIETAGFGKRLHLRLWQNGRLRAIHPDNHAIYSARLSSDGSTIYAMCGNWGTSTTFGTLLHDVRTGRRRKAMTGRIHTRWHTDVAISANGKTVAAKGSHAGLSIFRDGAAAGPAHPQIRSIRQRYEGSKLIVTIEMVSSATPYRVEILPMNRGYIDPTDLGVPSDSNPTFWMRWGRPAGPVRNRPGVYQFAVDFGKKQSLLDSGYIFRVIATNREANRSTFKDVRVIK